MKRPSQSLLLRICLIGLPLGTILLGLSSIVYTEFIRAEPTSGGDPSKPGIIVKPTPILKDDLVSHVDSLASRIGERHAGNRKQLDAARFYIESTLGINNMGYHVREHTYEAGDQSFTNVDVELAGTLYPKELIIVGAHYDSIPGTPGADDNASGVAALLTLAKAYVRAPQPRTIRFVAFANEEPPWFQQEGMGSLEYARSLQDKGLKVLAMISLESMGYYRDEPGTQNYPPELADRYPSTGNFLAIVGNLSSKSLVEFAHNSATAANRIPVEKGAFPALLPGVGWSDHWSFWQYGHPAVMLTDTAPYRNPHYHQPTDTPDQLDFDRLHQATETASRILLDLANAPAGTSFQPKE